MGRFLGRVSGPQTGNPLLRLAQFRAYERPEHRVAIARTFVAGNLHNYRQLLLRSARDATDARQGGLRDIAERRRDLAAIRASSNVLQTLIEERERVRVRGEWPESDHVRAASALLSMQSQRGMVFWITDLAETAMTPEVVESAGQLLARHVLAFVAVAQPELRRKAAEWPGTAKEMYEGAAAMELVSRRELLLARLRQRGSMTMESMPGDLSADVLNQYLKIKERNIT